MRTDEDINRDEYYLEIAEISELNEEQGQNSPGKCPTCGGTGEVESEDPDEDEFVMCPFCYGVE